MTSEVTLTGAAANAGKTAQQAIKLTDDFSDFLTLLTTQLQNQDPLSPMDSTEFTNQLVQFSQVEQGINTNQKLDDLLALQLSTLSSSMLDYVGLDITYTSAEMHYDGTQPVDINYALSKTASVLKVNVYDESGTLVRSMDAPTSSGAHKATWDGKDNSGNVMEPGTYSVKVEAADADKKPITVSTAVSGHVRGVESQDGVIFLLVGDRAVSLNAVIQAKQPPAAPPATTPESDA